jgi:hypothetical protein
VSPPLTKGKKKIPTNKTSHHNEGKHPCKSASHRDGKTYQKSNFSNSAGTSPNISPNRSFKQPLDPVIPLPTDKNLKQQQLFSFNMSLWHIVALMM